MNKDRWLEDIDKWQKEEDLAVIDRYYGAYGYESYQGIVRLISAKRGKLQPTTPASIPSPAPAVVPVTPDLQLMLNPASVTVSPQRAITDTDAAHLCSPGKG
jgi:hypothetical protein